MTVQMTQQATFKAIVRYDGGMVAALALLPDGKARFFIVQPRETQEQFIGRVSGWIKHNKAAGLKMQTPDMLAEGMDVGAVLLRVKLSLGIPRDAPDASEYEVQDVALAAVVPETDAN